jgi:hypothetical protein
MIEADPRVLKEMKFATFSAELETDALHSEPR